MSENNKKISRWYDTDQQIKQTFQLVETMTKKEREEFSANLTRVVNNYRKQQNLENFNVSLGRDKILAYYKAYNKRRWYDQIPNLMRAVNLLSILSLEEREQILNKFLLPFKGKEINNVNIGNQLFR
ncbi:MAG: hypothetical protein A2039_05835 [Candidatus Melainabacteria bacterium GWA2_34_9]|nr:MAG: hypothetical protein A2039_05835 [Candidatus Melainabacteria bacterium GWA2_34_9]